MENHEASRNILLNSLSPTEYEWLRPTLEAIALQQGDVLYRVKEPVSHVYFPTTCLFSWTNSTDEGDRVEIGMTGSEGMVGIPIVLGEETTPWQTEVQLSGKALRLPAKNFVAALDRFATFRQRVFAFIYLKLLQLNQSALCNRFHSVEARLCRWLLAAQDLRQTSELPLTREILAEMVGAGRPTVSLATGILQTAGLIRASRGSIIIVDREGLKDAACECYQVVREALDQYLQRFD